MLTGGRVNFQDAARMFDSNNKELEDILELADQLHIETEEDLARAANDGFLTLSEVNIILLRKFYYGESEDRERWISQHIFGSN